MRYILFFQFLLINALFAKLEQPLADNGGYHFKFEGKKYVLLMDTLGNLYFSSKAQEKEDPKEAKKQRILLRYASYKKDQNDQKMYGFIKMETKIVQKSSSFTLIIVGEMESGVQLTSKLEGDASKVVLLTEMTCPENFRFHMGFHVPEALKELESKGLVVKLTNDKNKITHQCDIPYETKYYRDKCRQVLVQQRNPLSLIFDSGKAEGHFAVWQHSHNAGGVLNNPFSIYYMNGSQNWDASKNAFIFSF